MKILVDTNVLISAFVFNGSVRTLMRTLFQGNFTLYVSDYIDTEFRDKLKEKWPEKAEAVYQLYRKMNFVFCESAKDVSGNLRDPKDLPVLSDAMYHHVDVILTGDSDFLDEEIDHPLILSPAMLLEFLQKKDVLQ